MAYNPDARTSRRRWPAESRPNPMPAKQKMPLVGGIHPKGPPFEYARRGNTSAQEQTPTPSIARDKMS